MRFTPDTPLKIGTRGSPLALAQAHEAMGYLIRTTDLDEKCFHIVVIKTTGDAIQDRPLGDIGGKGLFTKEIEQAMLDKTIDIAVHSMKDMPVVFPKGLMIECYLPREDARDAFISPQYRNIECLPYNATVGTSSLRRRAQLLNRRPDLNVVEFRGNVQTRLKKINDGVADASFLACAGLNRLGLHDLGYPIDPDDLLPAIAQGCIGIQSRENDDEINALLRVFNHIPSQKCLQAERALLAGLDGSCQTPIAGLAELASDGYLYLRAQVLRPDGSDMISDQVYVPISQAQTAGTEMAMRFRKKMDADFFNLS